VANGAGTFGAFSHGEHFPKLTPRNGAITRGLASPTPRRAALAEAELGLLCNARPGAMTERTGEARPFFKEVANHNNHRQIEL